MRRFSLCCRVLLPLLCVFGPPGCHLRRPAKPAPAVITVHQSPNLAEGLIRRVLMMPVDNQTSVPAAGPRFAELLATEIRGVRRFETVRLDHHGTGLIDPDWRSGRFAETMLIALRDTYNVDAIMFSTLKEFDPYWPPRFAASMQLVDTSSGETVWSVDGSWDTRDEHVARQAQGYFRHSSTGKLIGDPELALQSPEYVGKFVAHQMANALKDSWPAFENEQLVGLVGHTEGDDDFLAPVVAGESIETPPPSEPIEPALPLPVPSS